MISFVDIIMIMCFGWIFLVVCQLIINKNENSVPKWPTHLILILLTFTLLDNFLKPGMMPKNILTIIFIFSRNSYYLIGPFLLLYTKALLSQNKLKIYHLLHLIPFIVMLIGFLLHPASAMPIDTHPVTHMPIKFRDLVSTLLRASYCIVILKTILIHAKSVPDFYSRKTFRNSLSWLYYMTLFYLVLLIINLLFIVLPVESISRLFPISESIVRIAPTVVFILLFSLFAQAQPVTEDSKVLKTKYKNSTLNSDESLKLFEKLNSYLKTSQIYTDPDITLDTLSIKLNTTRHHLSEVINREFGDKFYSYINGFRLDEFIKCLEDNKYPNFTITAIALECGFKSTSSFFNLFKKRTGMTPKQYMLK